MNINKTAVIGKTATVAAAVTESDAARAVGSGALDVFATPVMIALMEKAACKALKDALSAGQTSVGARINVSHDAASPIGAEITATARITALDGRKVEFELTASDKRGEIGRGTHERFIVDAEKFMEKVRGRV